LGERLPADPKSVARSAQVPRKSRTTRVRLPAAANIDDAKDACFDVVD
jgi:hypothetical protein